jgi:fumarate hydratase class II
MKSTAGKIQNSRLERDSMGEVRVPANALYGALTQRAVENFPISNLRMPREFIRALGLIKMAAAQVNMRLGLLEKTIGKAIVKASEEVVQGELDDQFVVDVFQTGSGTSTNMNANEVISNRAIQILRGVVGSKKVHPNDHVNMGQSRTMFPTAMHISAMESIENNDSSALKWSGRVGTKRFTNCKIGRTHLRMRHPFDWVRNSRIRRAAAQHPAGSNLRRGWRTPGGTAVGTGINTHPRFAEKTIQLLRESSGCAPGG